ncbi:hypothetical protein QQ045_032495 [Rhodiola kirilowii]
MWENLLKELKAYRDHKIFDVFRLSFECIEDKYTKDLFLYIAYFFVGMDKEYSLKVLEGCKLRPISGLQNLLNRCLLTIDYHGKIMMHQSIEEMGKEIARQEAINEPGGRSKLWSTRDSTSVLQNVKGTSTVQGLRLYLPKPDNHTLSEHDNFEIWPKLIRLCFSFLNPWKYLSTMNLMSIRTSSFTMMSNLELLLLNNVQFQGGYEDFPKIIKWLLWCECPLQSIPSNFNLDELVVLDMQKSCLVHAWKASKYMGALRVLNLSYSQDLVCTPDLSCALMLECLYLEGCASLVEVHESIGTLINLAHLNLKGCTSLAKIHRSIETLKKLTLLNLTGCKSLVRFPNPNYVAQLNLAECTNFLMTCNRMESSVICSSNPRTILSSASSLPQYPVPSTSPFLPFNLYLPALKELRLARCGISREDVLGLLSCAPSLKRLNLSDNPIRALSNTDMRPTLKLDYLILRGCTELQSISHLKTILSAASSLLQYPIPSTSPYLPFNLCLPALTELNLRGCGISRVDVLGLLSCVPSLKKLDLRDNQIRVLDIPPTLKLYELFLSGCVEIRSISHLPCSCELYAKGSPSLKRISYINDSNNIPFIDASGSNELVEVDYCNDRLVIKWIGELDESEANQLGFVKLHASDSESILLDIEGRDRRIRRVFYRAGVYQVYLVGDHLAKWFNETTTEAELLHTVLDNQLDIRALNLGFMVPADSTELIITIKNVTRKWERRLYKSFDDWLFSGRSKITLTWLSHWRTVKEHREIKPGDLLHISANTSGFRDTVVTCGIKFIYEEEQQQVDEDGSEQHDDDDNVRQTDNSWSNSSIRSQTVNHIDKTTTSSIVGKRVDQEEEEDDGSTSVSNRYNNIFPFPLDLSIYEYKRHSDDEEDLNHKTRVYIPSYRLWMWSD